jgi:hypothetical protein
MLPQLKRVAAVQVVAAAGPLQAAEVAAAERLQVVAAADRLQGAVVAALP